MLCYVMSVFCYVVILCHVMSVLCYVMSVLCYVMSVLCYVMSVLCYVMLVLCYVMFGLRNVCADASNTVQKQWWNEVGLFESTLLLHSTLALCRLRYRRIHCSIESW